MMLDCLTSRLMAGKACTVTSTQRRLAGTIIMLQENTAGETRSYDHKPEAKFSTAYLP